MRIANWIAALFLVAGCGNRNDSIVVVTLTSSSPIEIATVHAQATAGGKTREFTLSPSGGPAATPLDFGIDVPYSISGTIQLHVDVFDGAGSRIGVGDGTTTIKAGGRADLEIPLVGDAVLDMGDQDLATAGPPDMAFSPPDLARPAMLSMDKGSQAFGDITINKSSSPTTFMITNTGSVATGMPMMTIGGSTPGDFSITTDCSAPIAPLDNCHVTATLSPKSAGAKQATFTIDAGPGASVMGTVTGNGLTPGQLSITPDTGDCGSALLMQTSTTTASFTVKNSGQTATSTLSISSSDSQFTASGCATALAPNATCSLTVSFKPTMRGTQNASIKAGDGPGDPSPAISSVSGKGLQPATLSITPSPFTFPSGPRLSAAGSQSFEVTNTGDVSTNALIASSITGTNASAFTVTADTCMGGALAPIPAKCSVTVKFTPSFTGAHTATLNIRDASVTLKSDTLNGSGTPIWVRELSSSAISGALRGVWAADSSHAWAVGEGQAIFARGATGTWTAQTTSFGNAPDYSGITGSGATDLWAMDSAGYYTSTGDGTWKASVNSMGTTVGGIFVLSPNDIWYTTTTDSGVGSTFMETTTAWRYSQSGTTSETAYQGCRGMWGVSDSDLYCAYLGKNCPGSCIHFWGVAHRDATGTWTNSYSAGSSTVMAPHVTIWGTSATNIYYADANSRPLHYNGSAWVAVDASAPIGPLAIWGSSASNIYFVGPFGIVQGDGSTWGTPYQPNGLSASGVWGTSANDVYVGGSDSDGMCVYHWF